MNPIPRPLLLLHPDAAFRERVRRAAGDRFDFQPVSSWEALREELQIAPPSTLSVVDPYWGMENGGLAGALRLLLAEFPSTTVLAALDLRPDRYRDLRTLGAWGVSEVIAVGETDSAEAL
jgi:hypothetical protein